MDKNYLIQLTNNLYRLTLLFPKKEPLRYKMRELADDIFVNSLRITNFYEFTNIKNPPKKTEVGSLSAGLEILGGFFEVLKLKQEHDRLNEEIKKREEVKLLQKLLQKDRTGEVPPNEFGGLLAHYLINRTDVLLFKTGS